MYYVHIKLVYIRWKKISGFWNKTDCPYMKGHWKMKCSRSAPGNKVRPVINSAIMHPTDQISTVTKKPNENLWKEQYKMIPTKNHRFLILC